ncbi:2406_t:CDS:2, partial [Gigaspora rosea]
MKVLIHKAHEFKSNDKTIIKALSLLRVIRHEILIMYNVSISDWMTAIIPPLFMAIVEEDRINKPFRPIPSGLITIKDAKHRLVAISFIFPVMAYIIGGLQLLFLCFMWQAWVIFNEVFKLGKNAFYKNFFSAFGTWISLVSCYYIIIGTNLRIFELLNSELNIFKLGICFFVMTTTQVQDLRDQKGDKFVGRKTLPLLIGDNIFEKNFEANINNGFVPYEFGIIEFILIALNVSSCIRLFIYRQPKQDNITYQKWYCGFYCTSSTNNA